MLTLAFIGIGLLGVVVGYTLRTKEAQELAKLRYRIDGVKNRALSVAYNLNIAIKADEDTVRAEALNALNFIKVHIL